MPRSLWACACFLAACYPVAFAGNGGGGLARVAISDLKPVYCKGDLLEVTIWNRDDRAISINVAVETLVGGTWIESWGSLNAPPEQIPTKILPPDLLEPGKSIAYSFDLFRFPIRADLPKARWRLRTDMIVDSKLTSFASPEFAICSD